MRDEEKHLLHNSKIEEMSLVYILRCTLKLMFASTINYNNGDIVQRSSAIVDAQSQDCASTNEQGISLPTPAMF